MSLCLFVCWRSKEHNWLAVNLSFLLTTTFDLLKTKLSFYNLNSVPLTQFMELALHPAYVVPSTIGQQKHLRQGQQSRNSLKENDSLITEGSSPLPSLPSPSRQQRSHKTSGQALLQEIKANSLFYLAQDNGFYLPYQPVG